MPRIMAGSSRRVRASLCGVALITLGAANLSAQGADRTEGAAGEPRAVPRCRRQLVPTIGAAPETGFELGLGAFAVCDASARSRATRPTSLTAFAMGSIRRQARVGIEIARWSSGNAQMVAGSALWQSFPLSFYGIGPGTPQSARELFTPRGAEVGLELRRRFAPGWYAGGTLRVVSRSITTDSTGALRRSQLPGLGAGPITEVGVGIQHDTRDNLFATRHGDWLQASYARSARGVLSDYDYGRLRLDARAYRALWRGHVLAMQVKVLGAGRGTPFDQLPLVGGSEILRGYELGRFRDDWLGAAQVEYRTPIVSRVGAVAFAGAGSVAPTFARLATERVLPTYGGGLRVELDARQRTALRVDVAFGARGAKGLYLGLGQAF